MPITACDNLGRINADIKITRRYGLCFTIFCRKCCRLVNKIWHKQHSTEYSNTTQAPALQRLANKFYNQTLFRSMRIYLLEGSQGQDQYNILYTQIIVFHNESYLFVVCVVYHVSMAPERILLGGIKCKNIRKLDEPPRVQTAKWNDREF